MNGMHSIDKPIGEPYTDEELEMFMVFCIINRQNLYATVCKCFDILGSFGLSLRKGLKEATEEKIEACLRSGGHRFPKQTARFLKLWGDNPIDPRTASRLELIENVKGIGWKLASMFLRNTRGERYAVIDVHIKSFMAGVGFDLAKLKYLEIEQLFLDLAKSMGEDPIELDLAIWNEYRRHTNGREKT